MSRVNSLHSGGFAGRRGGPATAGRIPLEIEQGSTLGRKVVEVVLYVLLLSVTLPEHIGLPQVPRLLGAMVLAGGVLTFLIVLFGRASVPVSVWFALLMNVGANVSQAFGNAERPILGEGLPMILHWMSYLIMFCYLVQNRGADTRVLLFCSLLLILVVAIGGIRYGADVRGERLTLEEGMAGWFSNANRLAYLAGLFAVALLFKTLRGNKLLRLVYGSLAVVLVGIMLDTVSRGAILTFACGLAVLLAAIMLGRGVRLAGIILVGAGLLVTSQLAFVIADPVHTLRERWSERSIRAAVYRMETLDDLADTLVFGVGPKDAIVSAAGITAHNTFIHTHLAFGGITAWPYLIWLVVLGTRTYRMVRATDLPLDVKAQVVCMFGMSLGANVLSNEGYIFVSSIYAIAVVEKHTAAYGRRRVARRKAAAHNLAVLRVTY